MQHVVVHRLKAERPTATPMPFELDRCAFWFDPGEQTQLLPYARGCENLYDPETGFIRPKDLEGRFITESEYRGPADTGK
jgi:hypothetical protein